MGHQKLLDFARVKVFSAANHHVLRSTRNTGIAFLVHRSEVTRVHPAVLINRICSLTGHVPVTLHHQEATDQNLALFAALNGLPGLRVNDFHFDVRIGASNSTHTLFNRVVYHCLVIHRGDR